MSLEKQIETLNTNIEKLVSIFEAYPNPIDEANEKKDSAVSRAKAKTDAKKEPAKEAPTKEEDNDAVEPVHSLDELAALAKKVLQADKATNQPKVKEKMKALGISKVSATPGEHIDEMYAFLEGLE